MPPLLSYKIEIEFFRAVANWASSEIRDPLKKELKAWIVALNDGGLLHSILSQKYFPSSTFLEARIGSSPSLTWRSIWGARDVLAAGLRWRVGDGKNIPIKGHPCLPCPGNFQLIERPATLLDDTKGRYELIWHFEQSGKFTVKSAYQVACGLRGGGDCSLPGRSWAFIWNSRAQTEVVMFSWKCALEAMPTVNQLQRRGVQVSDGCGACLEENEDLLHVFLHCNFARFWPAVASSGVRWS
ncbi:UNVERIFIED_CONTAM: hypothetical protein Slati_1003700 [Sesamum latifolium]|uniref:Reverse transcriptase zinc-binding domain-containing protein n=1 Tax=Sesamum latifolium TaxID=2727402 RepID=A0AAW2XXU9_9LAMI